MGATRPPLPPPFAVGERVRYCGTSRLTVGNVDVLAPGLEVVIDEVRSGHRGTGRLVSVDEDGEPVMDETSDGYSVYHVGEYGRCIQAEDAPKWRRTEGA